ncbi:hypothetical protein SPRG_03949 [Saprolegnia parasitica CBS 223.65]|uniref:EF-hand domain-containing protein n=1 Tax=Saprolegnia parasitica (strain CBS 223.65) TaxID=695850 RepID=A0A067CX03_SAPPC|nr:hypothetical protein SPRG_03949 [Saprolegnia parasitica CBS 223.65]KDO31332.1 hypothetical protein SPRG_03949 [Saprolegnia parasitica CBS 223.65]|eukprot:XP_012197931.1 hypothetical protein SPRG_03949 [Saprolegnia parasitica CBS 223.65]
MPKSGRAQASVFSRDEIGVEQLHSLKEKFADGDLCEVEFVHLFRETIDSTLSETQLTDLFQKIDANSDGTVSWDEFTNYMFLSGSDSTQAQLGDDMSCRYITTQPEKTAEAGDADTSAVRPVNNHRDIITRIVGLDKPHLYVTASRDGTVRTWNANTLAYQSTIATGRNWISDCCHMKRSNRLVVSSMNRTLAFYDMSTGQPIGEIAEYSKKQCIPLCMEYVEKPSDEREALVVGDDTGGITVMVTSNQWSSCDGRPGSHAVETHGFSTRTKYKKHTDWITRVKWVHDMRAIVATSLDTNISIIDIERMVPKFEFTRHKKGVFDLVWSSSSRFIASCGMERDISIWNPYSSQRASATLKGHMASVLHLAVDDDNFQIISVSSDNVFKVWDIRNHRCLQSFVDRNKSTGGADNRISALLFDRKSPGLISATTHLARWPLRFMSSEEAEANQKKNMCIACYNAVFNQVLTAEMSDDGVVRTWSAETGEEISTFSNAHGASPITAMTFDCAGRRLITGSHDGAQINMWNFSNGALVKQFLKHEKAVLDTEANREPLVRPPHIRDIAMLPDRFDAASAASPRLPSPVKRPLHPQFEDEMHAQVLATPRKARGQYQQSEVTCILDIERNVRVGMGEYMCQRFVCSVGWDRKIYVWLDDNDEDEPLPMWILPSDDADDAKRHTDDILCVVYIPPGLLATAGLDGKILLWNLNSGDFVTQLHQSTGSIEAMVYCNKLELILAGGEDGRLLFIDRVAGQKNDVALNHPNGEAIVVIACDRCGDNVITGDAAGYIKIWSLSVACAEKGLHFDYLGHWRVAAGRILSLDFIENTRQIDMFILVACATAEVSLWTLDGIQVGIFGKHKPWHLGRPATYGSSTPQIMHAKHSHTKQFIPSRSIALAMSARQHVESQFSDDSMPKPGEVWFCRTNHHKATSSTAKGSASDALMSARKTAATSGDATADIVDLITIIKVSKGEILAWDGISQLTPKQTTLKLEDFIRSNNAWAKDAMLSQCVGRIFMSSHQQTPYKCLYIAIKSPEMRHGQEGAFAFVDTEGLKHRTQSLDTSVATSSKLRTLARTVISASNRLNMRNLGVLQRAAVSSRQVEPATAPSTKDPVVDSSRRGSDHALLSKEAILSRPTYVCSTLPALQPREKHPMGGVLPKRSTLRTKHDPSADFRRVHDPHPIPKTAKEVIERGRTLALVPSPPPTKSPRFHRS